MFLGIDPGPKVSGWCVYHPITKSVICSGVDETEEVLEWLRTKSIRPAGTFIDGATLILEKVVSYGQRIGVETIQTIQYIGRMEEIWHGCRPILLSRPEVLGELTGSRNTKEAGAREALIDLHGGKDKAIGTKAAPGPLYGVKSHAWSALALCVVQSMRRDHVRAGL